jgi:hypothetical protein
VGQVLTHFNTTLAAGGIGQGAGHCDGPCASARARTGTWPAGPSRSLPAALGLSEGGSQRVRGLRCWRPAPAVLGTGRAGADAAAWRQDGPLEAPFK